MVAKQHASCDQLLYPTEGKDPQLNTYKYQNIPEAAEASALLQCLSKHLVFADVIVADRATGESHCFLKVVLPDLWHRVILFYFLQADRWKLS